MTSSSQGAASERTQRVVAVVLAAGRATRFGATKQLAEQGGRPLVAHVVAAARRAAAVSEIHVVVGHDADRVAAAAGADGPVTVVVNDAYADGQATSLRVGIASAAAAGATVAVVLLADEPDVTATAIERVVAAAAGGALAVRARYEDGTGHPVAFASPAFDVLEAVRGDRGARDLLGDLGVLDVPVAGPRPDDVDTREDLEHRRR